MQQSILLESSVPLVRGFNICSRTSVQWVPEDVKTTKKSSNYTVHQQSLKQPFHKCDHARSRYLKVKHTASDVEKERSVTDSTACVLHPTYVLSPASLCSMRSAPHVCAESSTLPAARTLYQRRAQTSASFCCPHSASHAPSERCRN